MYLSKSPFHLRILHTKRICVDYVVQIRVGITLCVSEIMSLMLIILKMCFFLWGR